MNRPKLRVSPDSHLILYNHAVPNQILEGIITAREALDPYYPAVTWPQWHQAFRDIQPSLLLDANRVTTTSQGLTELARYFEARYPSTVLPRLPATSLLHSQATALPPEIPLDSRRQIKKTYSMCPDVLESLSRVSYWRRTAKSTLINLAVQQLMATYSESQVPIPLNEV